MYDITRMPAQIDIGFTGEKKFRTIEIDMSKWMTDMPDGVPSIIHIRPGETKADAYIAATTFEENILRWNITAGDLGPDEGMGLMQVWLEEEENDSVEKRGKSVLVVTRINGAINDASEEVPASQEAFMEQMTALKVATVDAAEDAEDSAEDAEAWAVGQRGGTDVSSDDPTYHNNSKYYSEQSVSSATDAATAKTGAETAQGKAEDAQEAAETAQGKAEDAQEAAELAQEKAEDAQEAAETAQGKAEDAQEAAETAQEAAETAQGKAEDAQEAAETAQAAAEEAAGHYPQIDEDTKNWLVWDAEEEEYVDTGVKARPDVVRVQDTQPTDDDAMIWFPETPPGSVQVPTVAEMNAALAAKYEKPSSGIPSSDMASAVQTSLGKADTAYQKPVTGIPASDIESGVIPDPEDLIDDTAGTGDTDKVWSADKAATTVSTLNSAIDAKYTKPVGGIPASDLAEGVIPSVPVTDVQVNGVSVLDQGVANVPLMSGEAFGVAKVGSGVYIQTGTNAGKLSINRATSAQIKEGTQLYQPIVPSRQNESIYYGLAKLAGADMASVTGETVGVYPEAQKKAIRKMLGIQNNTWELISDVTLTEDTDEVWINTDTNGREFALSKYAARIGLTANATGANNYFYTYVMAKRKNGSITTESSPSGRWPSNGTAGFCELCAELIDDYIRSEMRNAATSSGNSQNIISSSTITGIESINGLKLIRYNSSSSPITAGTRITLYGIRIDE